MVGRYPLLFLILPLIVTGLCCSGFAMSVTSFTIIKYSYQFRQINTILIIRDYEGERADEDSFAILSDEVKTCQQLSDDL